MTRHIAVAAPGQDAADAALSIGQAGGNAVDAAIAVGNDLQRQIVNAWQSGRWPARQARQFAAVALR